MIPKIARKLGTLGGVTLVLGGATVIAIVVNVLLLVPGPQRALVGLTSNNGFIALYNSDNSRLLASSHQQKRYGLFIAMREHSQGATIIGPISKYPRITNLKSFTARAYGLSRIGKIIPRDYNPERIGSNLSGNRYVIAQGPYTGEVSSNWERSGYRVLAKDTSVSFFVYALRGGDTDVFIDIRLLNAEDTKAVLQ